MSSYNKCLNDVTKYCKKNYILGGPITSVKGKKKCKEDLRNAGVWGRDKKIECKNNLEQCNHTGCYDVSETYGKFGDVVKEAEPQLQSNSSLLKTNINSGLNNMMSKSGYNYGRGGKKKSRKSRTTRKGRTTRKSRKGNF